MNRTAKREQREVSAGRVYSVYYLPDRKAGYTAHIPGLGIVTEGRTLREARVMARDAIEGYIEAAVELGRPIPDDVTAEQVEVAV